MQKKVCSLLCVMMQIMRTMNKVIDEMREKMIKIYPPEDMPRYYKRIKEYFEMKMPHQS